MHNFVYLAQRRSQEFSCEPNFGGGGRAARPWLRHCFLVTKGYDTSGHAKKQLYLKRSTEHQPV